MFVPRQVFATTMRVAVEHHTHHWSFVILLGLCCFSVFPSVLIFGVFNADNTDGQSAAVFSSPAFWVRGLASPRIDCTT